MTLYAHALCPVFSERDSFDSNVSGYVRDCDVTYTLNGCLKNTDLQQSACYCDTDHCNGAISWAHVTGNHVIILVVTTVMTFFGL
ncbi:hypothetical protein DPMN_118836 [Dreissena polymorpha]|uniref:Protein quiver n=1 Tax=Dreissena polymorpha TaxID=45954 RepID=A0A9D4GKT8_DREPO|nr:hypothetical protein DPMN_118836 [Dreissena polymorpha]